MWLFIKTYKYVSITLSFKLIPTTESSSFCVTKYDVFFSKWDNFMIDRIDKKI
jgi:hypothetical protein